MSQQSMPLASGSKPPQREPQKLKPYRRSFASIRVIVALILREMISTYGRTPMGFLWVVAEPIAAISLLTAIFSLALREPALGTSFALFYATGFLPFFTYIGLVGKIGTSLTFSRALLNYPSVTWLDAIIGRFVLNFLADILVAVLVFGGILLIFDVSVIMDLPTIMLAMWMAAYFSLGLGVLNAFLFLRLPAWQRIFGILMRPMFFMSCVFFLFDDVPVPYRDWLWWNPVVHMTGLMRRGFYSSYEADWVSLIYVFGLASVLLIAGMILLRKSHQDLLDL